MTAEMMFMCAFILGPILMTLTVKAQRWRARTMNIPQKLYAQKSINKTEHDHG